MKLRDLLDPYLLLGGLIGFLVGFGAAFALLLNMLGGAK